MTAIRKLGFGLMGESYYMGDWVQVLIYEYRKDLMTYLTIVLLIYAFRMLVRRLIGEAKYDLVLASGVLLYLDQAAATKLVAEMLGRTRKVLVITALAHPDRDNEEIGFSKQRESDGTWIHNVDQMVADADGRVAARRWEGGRIVDGNTIYFLYALPSPGPQ